MKTRDPFALAAVFLAAVAFAGSFDHTLATVRDHGQDGWVAVATALMPEVSVALSVLRIRKGGRTAQLRWAWLVLVSSALFTLWANLEQAQPTVGGLIVGGWPAWAAIGAAGFIEMSGAPKAVTRPVKRPSAQPVAQEAPEPVREPLRAVAAPREVSDVEAWIVSWHTEHGVWPTKADFKAAGIPSATGYRNLNRIKEAAA